MFKIEITEHYRNGNEKTYSPPPNTDTAEGCGELVWIGLSEASLSKEIIKVVFTFVKVD